MGHSTAPVGQSANVSQPASSYKSTASDKDQVERFVEQAAAAQVRHRLSSCLHSMCLQYFVFSGVPPRASHETEHSTKEKDPSVSSMGSSRVSSRCEDYAPVGSWQRAKDVSDNCLWARQAQAVRSYYIMLLF